MNYTTVDISSMQGLISSILLIALAKLLPFLILSTGIILNTLQGLSYLFAILLAIDTFTGNPIKSWVQKKLKSNKNAHKKNKPTGSSLDKVS